MGGYPPLALFLQCSERLKHAKIRHQDFRKTLAGVGAKSFVYADPPYFTASERIFVEYGRRSFGAEDLSDLLADLRSAEQRGALVALTYHEAAQLKVPSHWHRSKFEVTRNVGGFRGARKRHSEVLYTSFPLGNSCQGS